MCWGAPLMKRKHTEPSRKKEKQEHHEQQEPRRYKGVFWSTTRGMWMAQITHPPGCVPRQEYVEGSWHKDQKKSAEARARVLKCKVADQLLPGLGPVEKNTPRLYHGVIWREEYQAWTAQITFPAGHVPRQMTVGWNYSSQKEAATAKAKKMTELKMKKPDGKKTKWTLADVRMKKAKVYQGEVAMHGQVKKFKIWSRLFVKRTAEKSWIPGSVYDFHCNYTASALLFVISFLQCLFRPTLRLPFPPVPVPFPFPFCSLSLPLPSPFPFPSTFPFSCSLSLPFPSIMYHNEPMALPMRKQFLNMCF